MLFPRNIGGLSDSATLAKFLTEVVHWGYVVLPEENAFALVDELHAAHAWKPGIRDEVEQ